VTEVVIAARWLYAVLHQDVTLTALLPGGIHDEVAPIGTAYPYLVLANASAVDFMTHDGHRVWSDELWDITAWAKTSDVSGVLGPIMYRVDQLLHRGSGTVTGASTGVTWSCVREAERKLTEPTDATIRGLQATYRLKVTRTG
jgi:hypothetical protein